MLSPPVPPLAIHLTPAPSGAGTPRVFTPPRIRTPLQDRTKAMIPGPTPAPRTFSLAMYPDIADAILASASYDTQTTLRRVCVYFRERVDAQHCGHIALRTAMCRSPLLSASLRPSPATRSVSASGVYLVAARPDRQVRHDADRIWGYFYAGNAVPCLGFALAFGSNRLSAPPARQAALLKHVRVLDVYANDIDWEFAAPRAQLDAALRALDPAKVHTLRFAEEADPWWYTRLLTPSVVVFDLRHFDAARPGKHSTHSLSLACPVVPVSAATVVIHVPVHGVWRLNAPPLGGFVAHAGTQRVVLLFRKRWGEHRAQWEGVAPPLGVLHRFLQENRVQFPRLQLLVVGADDVDPCVFGRALMGGVGAGVEEGGGGDANGEGEAGGVAGDGTATGGDAAPAPGTGESGQRRAENKADAAISARLARAVRDSAGVLGWSDEQAARAPECIRALGVGAFRATLAPGEWETYTSFPHYA